MRLKQEEAKKSEETKQTSEPLISPDMQVVIQ